jgi:hypothetical protein
MNYCYVPRCKVVIALSSYLRMFVVSLIASLFIYDACPIFANDATSSGLPENPYALDSRYTCGPNCAAFCLNLLRRNVEYSQVLEQCRPDIDGVSLQQVSETLREFGLNTSPFEASDCSLLQHLPAPLILHTKKGFEDQHFIVLLGYNADSDKCYVFSPPNFLGEISHNNLCEMFTGIGLVVSDLEIPPIEDIASNLSAEISLIDFLPTTFLMLTCILLLRRNQRDISDETGRDRTFKIIVVVLICNFGGCAKENFSDERNFIDLGTHYNGDQIEKEYEIRNGSREPFKIVGIDCSCSCQQVQYDKNRELQPGENDSFKVSFTVPENRHEDLLYQCVVRTTSKDKTYSSIPYTYRVKVQPFVTIVPSQVVFGEIAYGARVKRTVRITPNKVEHMEQIMQCIRSAKQGGVVTIERLVQKDSYILLTLSPSRTALPGAFTDDINLNVGEKFRAVLPISGVIKSDIEAIPRVARVRGKEGSVFHVELVSSGSQKFKVKNIESTLPITSSSKLDQGNRVRFTHSITRDIEEKSGEVVYSIDNSQQQVVRVPVHLY